MDSATDPLTPKEIAADVYECWQAGAAVAVTGPPALLYVTAGTPQLAPLLRQAGYDVHLGVLASAQRPKMPGLLDVIVKSKRLVVLEGSNDHENIGAIARSARALGFDAMVLSPNCADPYYRRCVRVSMGEINKSWMLETTHLPSQKSRLMVHRGT